MSFNRQRLADSAIAENFDSSILASNQTPLRQRLRSNFAVGGEYFKLFQVDHGYIDFEGIMESPLRQASLQGHLPAFKSGTRSTTRARALALVSPASGFPVS